jgi:hypothetical protein
VEKSDSAAIKQKTKELRKQLDRADMDLFDRYMKWLVAIDPTDIDQKQRQILAEKKDRRLRH